MVLGNAASLIHCASTVFSKYLIVEVSSRKNHRGFVGSCVLRVPRFESSRPDVEGAATSISARKQVAPVTPFRREIWKYPEKLQEMFAEKVLKFLYVVINLPQARQVEGIANSELKLLFFHREQTSTFTLQNYCTTHLLFMLVGVLRVKTRVE